MIMGRPSEWQRFMWVAKIIRALLCLIELTEIPFSSRSLQLSRHHGEIDNVWTVSLPFRTGLRLPVLSSVPFAISLSNLINLVGG